MRVSQRWYFDAQSGVFYAEKYRVLLQKGNAMNKTIECLIKCPFYQSEHEKYITCEGFIANTCMVTRFASSKTKRLHINENCSLENGGNCPMAKSLFEKYGMRDLVKEIAKV